MSSASRVDSSPWWNTRAAVVTVAVLAFIATLIFYCPSTWMLSLVVIATDGTRTALWMAGAAAAGAVLLRAARIRCGGLLGFASATGLGLGLFGLIALGLGLAGRLNLGTALAMPAIGVIAFAILIRARLAHLSSQSLLAGARRWLSQPAGLGWLWIIVVISLATSALGATVMPGDLWKPLDPHPYDVVSYHLQVPREWYEAGRIVPLEHNVFSYFPFNVEIQYLLLMEVAGGPWRAMYSCQLLSVGYTLLMLLAIAGTGDAEESKRGVVAAAVASCVPWTIMLASTAYVESALMLYTALAVAWAVRALRSRFDWRMLALAGAFAGLAAGVKITAVPMLILGVAGGLVLLAKRIKHGDHGDHGDHGEKIKPNQNESQQSQPNFSPSPSSSVSSVISVFNSSLFGCAVFLIASGLLLSPWLIRNIAWAGNPLFPVAMRTLGHGHFSEAQVQRFVIAHSPTATERPVAARIGITWRSVLDNWQFGYLLLPAGLIAAWLRRRDPAAWQLLIVGAFTFVTWFGFTHLLSRFLIMLVPIAALLLAEVRWRRAWPIGVLLAIAAAIIGQWGVYPRLSYTTRDPVRAQLIGMENLSFMVPPELAEMSSADTQVGLVGDAGAFLYQIPMTRLHYRTVFDLPGGITNPVTAWLGYNAADDPNYLLIINPSEIARLHSTYLDVPALPAKWQDRQEPFVIRGGRGHSTVER